jgi:four helix bundle protein
VDLGLLIYATTGIFPDHERFGLTNQLRRAGVSVSSNIAEGYGRGSTADYLRFLRVARGSLFEIDTQLLFAVRLGYLSEEKHGIVSELCRESGRILAGLIRSIEESDSSPGAQH